MMREMNMKISRVFRMGQTFMNERAKEYGLSSGLFFYLLELSEQDGLTLQELSQAVDVDNGYTTRAIKKLLDMGYVNKVQNPSDSRSSIIYLTDKGKDISIEVKNIFLEWKDIVVKGVSEEDLLLVNCVFNKFYENANKAR